MKELPEIDNVFPFVCQNTECREVYELEDFVQVALLWGFIYLVSNEHQIIGVSCPQCHFTSLRKYILDTNDFSFEKLEQCCQESTTARGNKSLNIKFRNFIPFSKTILYTQYVVRVNNVPQHDRTNVVPFSSRLSLTEELFQNDNTVSNITKGDFSLPEFITPTNKIYSDKSRIDLTYNYNEKYILHLRDIENTIRKRALPRVVSNYNIYHFTDTWLKPFPYDDGQQLKIKDDLVKAFELAVRFKNISKYNTFVRNDLWLSTKHIDVFSKLVDTWYADRLPKRFDYFNGYARARNGIDYDIAYRDKFMMNFVYNFEVLGNKVARKHRPDQRHRLACIEAAKNIWKVHRSMTIADMIQRNEIANACEGKLYGEKTIRKWIQSECPDPKRGRPKNKK